MIIPLGPRILLKPVEIPLISPGGIHLPENVIKPLEGYVVATGIGRGIVTHVPKRGPRAGARTDLPNRNGEPVEGTFKVKVGDKVLLNMERVRDNHEPLEVFDQGEKYWMAREEWVDAVLS